MALSIWADRRIFVIGPDNSCRISWTVRPSSLGTNSWKVIRRGWSRSSSIWRRPERNTSRFRSWRYSWQRVTTRWCCVVVSVKTYVLIVEY